jgi:hypothetical protein
MIDNQPNDFERRPQARLDQHRAAYADTHEQVFGYRPSAAEPPPDLGGLSLEEALVA